MIFVNTCSYHWQQAAETYTHHILRDAVDWPVLPCPGWCRRQWRQPWPCCRWASLLWGRNAPAAGSTTAPVDSPLGSQASSQITKTEELMSMIVLFLRYRIQVSSYWFRPFCSAERPGWWSCWRHTELCPSCPSVKQHLHRCVSSICQTASMQWPVWAGDKHHHQQQTQTVQQLFVLWFNVWV